MNVFGGFSVGQFSAPKALAADGFPGTSIETDCKMYIGNKDYTDTGAADYNGPVIMVDKAQAKPGADTTTAGFYVYECVSLSPGGKDATLWKYSLDPGKTEAAQAIKEGFGGATQTAITNNDFKLESKTEYRYAGMQSLGSTSGGDMVSKWVYRGQGGNKNEYLAVGYSALRGAFDAGNNPFIVSHRWDSGAHKWKKWERTREVNGKIMTGYASEFPMVGANKNLPTWDKIDTDGNLNSRRVIISEAKLTYKGEPIQGRISLMFNDAEGAYLDINDTNTTGIFSFSLVDFDSDIWISGITGTVALMAQVKEKNLQKVFLLKVGDVYPADQQDQPGAEESYFQRGEGLNSTTIVLKNVHKTFNLEDADKVSAKEFRDTEATGTSDSSVFGDQGGGSDSCGKTNPLQIFTSFRKVIASAICNLAVLIHDLAINLLTYSMEQLNTMIGTGTAKDY